VLNIYIDADGCAVKEETYKVAARYKLHVFVVANKAINIPLDENIEMQIVGSSFDAADDWIVEQIGRGDILITSDILLADRAIKKQARVLGAKGEEFTEDNIGSVLATRELMGHLRQMGEKSGPSPMGKNDRSRFLSTIDQIIQSELRRAKRP
jgi:hypothetical protein